MSGATDAELNDVEAALHARLPADYRAMLTDTNGREGWFGDCYLVLYGTEALISVNREIERHPGFLASASDGSRELIGFDMRRDPPPIVMIDITSAGCEEAWFQAHAVGDFMDQRREGRDLRWDSPYQSDQ